MVEDDLVAGVAGYQSWDVFGCCMGQAAVHFGIVVCVGGP